MRSRPGRILAAPLLLPLLLAIVCAWSGCQHNRSFFQMDSDSRSPFFGVDLSPKWPQRASATESVSRFQSEETQVAQSKPADTSEPPTRSSQPLTLPLGDRTPTTTVADTAPVEQFR